MPRYTYDQLNITSSLSFILVVVRQMVRFGSSETPQRGTPKTCGPAWAMQSTVAIQRWNFRHPQMDQGGQGLADIQGVSKPGQTPHGDHASARHQPSVHSERRKPVSVLQLYDITVPEAGVFYIWSSPEGQSVRGHSPTQQTRQHAVWGPLLKNSCQGEGCKTFSVSVNIMYKSISTVFFTTNSILVMVLKY